MDAPLKRAAALPLIQAALREDRARNDLTSEAVLPAGLRVRARIIAKAHGILAGGPVAVWTFQTVDPSLRCRLKRREGAHLARDQTILAVEGRARSIFAAERIALNLLSHLSGIATLTRTFASRLRGTRAQVFDTRKTLPGLRALEKYAVRVGGGLNHRSNLQDAILIKTNHLRALAGSAVRPPSIVHRLRLIQHAITASKRAEPRTFVEIEVTNLRQFKAALEAKPDAILLDNWRLSAIRRAVALRSPSAITHHPSPLLEVSGGVTLANVRAIAKTGVDRISIGCLTHSPPALDVSLQAIGRQRH